MTQKIAMIQGTILGVFWIVKFVFYPLGLNNSFFMLLFIVLTLCVPVLGFLYTRTYRDKLLGGSISFTTAWSFYILMFMYAALLTAVAHFIYFNFIDHGYLVNTIQQRLLSVPKSDTPGLEMYMSQIQESLDLLKEMSPFDMTMNLLMQNILIGTLLGLPTALLLRKNKQLNTNE